MATNPLALSTTSVIPFSAALPRNRSLMPIDVSKAFAVTTGVIRTRAVGVEAALANMAARQD
jgi:hypothetical protein